MSEDRESGIGVSWPQVAASALAAVSSAVLLSTLGVAGTLIGAALGSVIATIATAVYTRTLHASREQVAAQAAALRRVTRARSRLDDAVTAIARGEDVSGTGISRAGRELDEAEEMLAAAADPNGASDGGDEPGSDEPRSDDVLHSGGRWQAISRGWPPGLSWRRLAGVAAAVFVVAMGVITAFELTTGRAVSSYTGGSDRQTGSTVPGLERSEPETPAPSDEVTPGDPTEDPTDDPTDDATGDTPGPSPTDSATDPAETPSDGATPSPTDTPELTVSPTALPSPTAAG